MEIRIEEQGAWRRVTVCHPAKLNIVTPALLEALAGAFDVGPATRGVVLTGEGPRAFIGGADIGAMAALDGPAAAQAFIGLIHRACQAIRDCPVPVIARIQGWCLGAGMEIAAACDLRLAEAGARFGMPEVRVGLPSVVEAALLPGLIGWGRTRRLLLLGETIDAATAEAWGFVEGVTPEGALDAGLADWQAALEAAGPRAIRAQKALIRQWEALPLAEAIAAGIPAFGDAFATDEPRRMLRAFLDRPR